MERLKARPDITDLIKKVTESQGLNNYTIVNVETNDKGQGYLGEIFMVTVTGADRKNNLHLVIKAAFVEDKIRQIAPIRMCFENETVFYSEVYPEFKKLDKKLEPQTPLAPNCWSVSLDSKSEMLAMENLKVEGFEVFDKESILDHSHVELIFKTYGRYHAYTFALKDQKYREYQRLASKLQDVYEEFMKQNIFRMNLFATGEIVRNLLLPGEDDKLIKAVEALRGERILEMFNESKASSCLYSTILHGDCWSNNMLFKYEDVGGQKKPTDIRLIDFQLLKVGNPVCDLSYFLYSGTSKEVFDRLDEYLKIYHESFSSVLTKLGSDPETLFPFHVLKDQWRIYSKFGLIMAILVLKLKLAVKEDLIDLTDDIENDDAFVNMKFNEAEYSSRIKELLAHVVEIGAL